MQPSIKRRSFLQALIGVPALAALWPRVAHAQPLSHEGLTYSDSDGTTDLAVLDDGNLTTGIVYGA